jgi:hypothetical protein
MNTKTLLQIIILFFASLSYTIAQIIPVEYQGQVTLSNGNPVSGVPVLVSGDMGTTFQAAGFTNVSGYYSGVLNVAQASTYFLVQIIGCNNNYVTTVFNWNGADTSVLFSPLVYCNTVSDTFSLCINAFVTDTNSLNANTYAIYLIQSATTASGDSLYLVNTDTINAGTFACFDNLVGTFYAKAMMLPGSSDYGSYVPTYQSNAFLWGNASALNSNSQSYQNINLIPGTPANGPGFIGGLVTQGANRLESENAVGDPIPGVDIILTNSSGLAVKHVQTDQNGMYSFSNLEYGLYQLCADVLNKPCIAPIVVNVAAGQDTVTNTQFSLGADGVFGWFTNSHVVAGHAPIIRFIENPVHQAVRLYNSSSQLITAEITITDITGRVYHNQVYELNRELTINAEPLSSGLYLIRCKVAGEYQHFKFVKQ